MGSDLEDFLANLQAESSRSGTISRRRFLPGVSLSIVGSGGLMFRGMAQPEVDRLVALSAEQGINYFDSAPSYGEGEAEEKLGSALQPYRGGVFLGCKTLARSASLVRQDLEQSLRRLRSSHIDLYQFHAVNRAEDVEAIFAPLGAMEAFLHARQEGKIRFIGFSSHSVPIALELMNRFRFDSILFPVNFACYERGNFGPQVIDRARDLGVAAVALKALAFRPWQKTEAREYPNCWYRPIDSPEMALQAMRFALSENVTALIPPADERLYRMTLALASRVSPMSPSDRSRFLSKARGIKPIMTAKKK
jgi:aryl-alcohol dehydrogenase-like predicted oxidoreductase